jgi:hypothetical protein
MNLISTTGFADAEDEQAWLDDMAEDYGDIIDNFPDECGPDCSCNKIGGQDLVNRIKWQHKDRIDTTKSLGVSIEQLGLTAGGKFIYYDLEDAYETALGQLSWDSYLLRDRVV